MRRIGFNCDEDFAGDPSLANTVNVTVYENKPAIQKFKRKRLTGVLKMTIPYLSNCSHRGNGWCLNCTKELGEENERLRDSNRLLRDFLYEVYNYIDIEYISEELERWFGAEYENRRKDKENHVVEIKKKLTKEELDLLSSSILGKF